MMIRRGLGGGLLAAALSAGCGSGGNNNALDVGGYDSGTFSPGASDAGAGPTLDAYIEQGHTRVTFVTLSCAGDCAMVQAVGVGGNPPYTYQWENGSTSAARRVCPTSSTGYSVNVTDTGMAGEFPTPPETARASLTAGVLACPDGGETDAGETDAGGLLCVSNPSFEGTPENDTVNAPPWVACGDEATISNQSEPGVPGALLQPTDGNTDLFLRAEPQQSPSLGAVSEPLCATMHAGTSYHVTLDLASPLESSASLRAGLQIWGGSTSCALGELLWSSPLEGSSWATQCATLAPTMDATYLTLVAYTSPDAGLFDTDNVQADHMQSVPACP